QLRPRDDRVDQCWTIMGKRGGDAGFDLTRILDPDATDAYGFCHRREVWIFEVCAGGEEARGNLLQLDKAELAIVENNELHGQVKLREAQEVSHQHAKAAV